MISHLGFSQSIMGLHGGYDNRNSRERNKNENYLSRELPSTKMHCDFLKCNMVYYVQNCPKYCLWYEYRMDFLVAGHILRLATKPQNPYSSNSSFCSITTICSVCLENKWNIIDLYNIKHVWYCRAWKRSNLCIKRAIAVSYRAMRIRRNCFSSFSCAGMDGKSSLKKEKKKLKAGSLRILNGSPKESSTMLSSASPNNVLGKPRRKTSSMMEQSRSQFVTRKSISINRGPLKIMSIFKHWLAKHPKVSGIYW